MSYHGSNVTHAGMAGHYLGDAQPPRLVARVLGSTTKAKDDCCPPGTEAPCVPCASPTLGAASTAISYYASASQLHWSMPQMKKMRDSLVSMDIAWHRALAGLPLSWIRDESTRVGVRAFMQYPMPIAAEMALTLEVLGGNRPLDENCLSMLLFARDRMLGGAGAAVIMAGTAGTIASVMVLVPVDLGVSAATLGTLTACFGLSAALMAGLGKVLAAMAEGKVPDPADVALVVDSAAVVTGQAAPTGAELRNAVSALGGRQSQEDTAARSKAIDTAKAASARKLEACKSRGGVFDPQAPGGCRMPTPKKVKVRAGNLSIESTAQSSGLPSLAIFGGAAALAILVLRRK